MNESEIRADELEISFRFQFGHGAGARQVLHVATLGRPLRVGMADDFDLELAETELPGSERFSDLEWVTLDGIDVYDYRQDATRPIRSQGGQGLTIYAAPD